MISKTLKGEDIDYLKQLLELVKERASHTKAFASSQPLEHVWHWKSFITLYLHMDLDAFVGTSKIILGSS